jgi:dolichyl-phosphate beta-glucosyltransferase
MSALSIIIPCYNEEKRLPAEKITEFLAGKENIKFILINDGSIDKTQDLLEEIKKQHPSKVFIFFHDNKMGKAEAVRTGFMESIKDQQFSHHAFLDADLSISPGELFRLYQMLLSTEKKFIFGSRVKKIGSNIVRNELRHFYSRIIATIVGAIIRLNVYDTQCSAKIFQTGLVPLIFNDKFKTRWLFDVEVICRIHNHYGDLNAIGSEEPVLEWIEKKGSKLRWYNFFGIVKEVFVLRKYYRKKR